MTWTGTSTPTNDWWSVTSSADGTRLAAVAFGGGIYLSTDGGITWNVTSAPANEPWNSIAGSQDGSTLVATSHGWGPGQGAIYVSTNSGNTWTKANAPADEQWEALACSADGSRVAASALTANSAIFRSADSGASWEQTYAPAFAYWSSIASSADGNSLVAVGHWGDFIFTRQIPALTVSRNRTGFTLSWPATAEGFTPEQKLNLSALWNPLTNIPTLFFTNMEKRVTLPSFPNGASYRLRGTSSDMGPAM
jgi:photosystem II stability/assembly factor-like uncharacterized protein